MNAGMASAPLSPEKGIVGWRFLLLLEPDAVFQMVHDLPNRGFYWEHGAQ